MAVLAVDLRRAGLKRREQKEQQHLKLLQNCSVHLLQGPGRAGWLWMVVREGLERPH